MQLYNPRASEPRRFSLLTQLVLFGLAIAIPILVFWALALISYSQAERVTIEQKARWQAHEISEGIEHELRRLTDQLTTLAASRSLRADRLAEFYGRAATVSKVYEAVVVVRDAGGQQVLNTRVPYGTPLPRSNLPQEARQLLANGKPHVSNLYRGAVSQEHVVTVTIPIIVDGEVVRSISIAVHPNRIFQSLGVPLPPDGWVATIVDREGIMIASTQDHDALVGKQALPVIGMGKQARLRAGADEIDDHRGQRVLRAYHRMDLTDWLVLVQMPVSQLAKPFAVRWNALAGGGLLLLTITSLLAYFMAKNLLREFRGLGEQAAALVSGTPIPKRPSRLSEAGELIRALDEADAQLRERNEALRHRQEQLRTVLDRVPAGLFRTDLKKHVTYANPRLLEMANTSFADMNGRRWLDELPEPSRKMLEEDWAAAIAENGYFERELIAQSVRRGLGEIYINFLAVADRDADGNIVGYIGTVTDVTQRKRVQQALTVEMDRFRRLTDASPDAVFLHDVSSHEITFLNRSLHGMLDLEALEAPTIGAARFYDLMNAEDADAYQAHMKSMRKAPDNRLDQIEVSLRSTQGSTPRWLLIRTVVFTHHPDGRVNQVLCIASDITQRKQADAKLAAERDRFERMALASPDMVFLYDLQAQTWTHLNRPWSTVLGFTEPDGSPLSRTHALRDLVYEEDRVKLDDHVQRLKVARDGMIDEIEFRAPAPNGTMRWFLNRSVVFERSEDRSVRQILGVVTDITARKQAEQMLAEENDRFKRIALASPDLVYLYDRQARKITFMNRSLHEALGYEASPMPAGAEEMLKLIFPEDLDGAHDTLRATAAIDDGRYAEYTGRFRGPKGATRWLRNRSLVFSRHPDRRAHLVLGIVTDITESRQSADAIARSNAELEARVIEEVARREQAQSELARALKLEAIGRLTGGVAHDFANMLAVVTTSLHLFRAENAGQVPMDLIEDALAGAETGRKLTQRLLSFARRQPTDPVPIDLGEHLGRNIRWIQNVLGEDIEVRTNFARDVGTVVLDESGLDSTIINLVMNARDAMPRGGRLTFETGLIDLPASAEGAQAGAHVYLSITDTGTGMTPEVLQRAFDPFFTTKATDGTGTGLGLSSVYGFMKKSHGHVELRSTPGQGTCVTLYVPKCSLAASVGAARRGDDIVRGQGERIVIVEDLAPLREALGRMLRSLGYVTLLAENGPAAKALIASEIEGSRHIDAVLSDIRMPGGVSGRDLAIWIRENYPGIEVVLMTALDDADLDCASGKPVAAARLMKPFTPAQLTQALHAAWSTRRRAAE